jgi:hypothetical protein
MDDLLVSFVFSAVVSWLLSSIANKGNEGLSLADEFEQLRVLLLAFGDGFLFSQNVFDFHLAFLLEN